jgi:hypothetical protein
MPLDKKILTFYKFRYTLSNRFPALKDLRTCLLVGYRSTATRDNICGPTIA